MKNLGTAIVILFGTILFLIVVFGVYFLRTNTSFLSFDPPKEEIIENNTNLTDDSSDLNDYSKLVSKTVEVPEQHRKGVFEIQRKLNLPENYSISVIASELSAPRFFDFHTDGSIIVAEKGAGRILMLKDNDEDKYFEDITVIDSDLRNIHSVYFYKGVLYSAEEDKVSVYKGLERDGRYQEKSVLISNLPSGGGLGLASGHVTRTIVIGPDEKIYLSVGSSCNLCEEEDERRATIMRYDLDGKNGEIFANGLRNSVGFVFHDEKIWAVDNGRDRISDDVPPEEVNIIEEGGNYGWPYCHGQGAASPEFPEQEEFCKTETKFPAYEMQAHSAPLGIDYYPTSIENEILADNLFIAFHGSWNRTVPTGYKVVRIPTTADDAETINFVTGWLEEDGESWGRPVGVKFDDQGKLYISDDGAGAIYLVQEN